MKKVILFEEDSEVRGALAKILRMWGYNVIQAATEPAVYAALASARPVDLIFAGATCRERWTFLSDLRIVTQFLPVVFLPDYHWPKLRIGDQQYSGLAKCRSRKVYLNVKLAWTPRTQRIAPRYSAPAILRTQRVLKNRAINTVSVLKIKQWENNATLLQYQGQKCAI